MAGPVAIRGRAGRGWRIGLVAVAAAVGAFIAGVALGYRPPGPLRDIVSAFGVDVPSLEQEEAEEAVDKLAVAIAERDPQAFVRANREAKEKVAKLKDSDPEGHDQSETEREALEVRALQLWPCLYGDPSCEPQSYSPTPTPTPTPSASLPSGVSTSAPS